MMTLPDIRTVTQEQLVALDTAILSATDIDVLVEALYFDCYWVIKDKTHILDFQPKWDLFVKDGGTSFVPAPSRQVIMYDVSKDYSFPPEWSKSSEMFLHLLSFLNKTYCFTLRVGIDNWVLATRGSAIGRASYKDPAWTEKFVLRLLRHTNNVGINQPKSDPVKLLLESAKPIADTDYTMVSTKALEELKKTLTK